MIRQFLAGIVAFFLAHVPAAAIAAGSDVFASDAVKARLITAQAGIAPGTATLTAGLDLDLGEGWKTYWRSPGEVGLPPEIDWSGSQNVARVEFFWPAPERFTAFGIENFGYHDEVVFPLSITLQQPGEPVTLKASVSLLTCSLVCVPQTFDLDLALPRATGIDQEDATRIAGFARRVPVDGDTAGLSDAVANVDPGSGLLTLALRSPEPFRAPDIFPELGEGTALGKPDIRLGDGGRMLWAELPILALNEITGEVLLTITDAGRPSVTLPLTPATRAPPPPFSVAQYVPEAGEIVWILLIAFLGGMILNVMPCVLPVLSIKLSAAARMQGADPDVIRRGFLVSAAGVMAFMWVLAAAIYALQGLGATVGWGLQFQNPAFLTLMFVVLAVFSANMFGAFEITLPSSLQTRMARAGGVGSHTGDFLSGVFAAVLATPCSAPFLGTAIAFALAGRGIDILLVFSSLGLGLSVPYLAVAAAPRLVRLLPRPGRWMIVLKLVLAALLALTALWLVWVLRGVAGNTVAAIVAGLTLALVAVLSGRLFPAPIRWGALAGLIALPMAASVLATGPDVGDQRVSDTRWVAFERAEIARLVSRGSVVFVDVTADWCLTCKANKVLVLERDPVAPALASPGIVAMQADWTRPDERISRYLESFGRYAIPFNAVYGPGAPDGIALSEVLTPSAVLEAIDQARGASVAARSEPGD